MGDSVGGLDKFTHRQNGASDRSPKGCRLEWLTRRAPKRGARIRPLFPPLNRDSTAAAWLASPMIDPQILLDFGAAGGAPDSSKRDDAVRRIIGDVGEQESSRG